MSRILCILAILIFFESGLIAQNAQPPKPHFSAIIVMNMDTSISWYTQVLMLEVINKTELPERGIRQANLRNDYVAIELIELKDVIRLDTVLQSAGTNKITGIFKIGFVVDDFDSWMKSIQKQNPEVHGNVVKDHLTGKKMVILLDPDGNRVQFFEK